MHTALGSKVSYQGEAGSNSHAACLVLLPDAQSRGFATFEEALAEPAQGRADFAVIPIENSLAGRVADIHRLLPESDLHIVAEYFMPIHFSVLAVPGAGLSEITTVRSHIHALGQCREVVRTHGWRTEVGDDTAGAAREVAAGGDPRVAALAPKAAAALYGLSILLEDVEDLHTNTTRFVVLAREPHDPGLGTGPVITSFVFRVRNVPAALYKALGGFASNGVNMVKLESYQPGGTFTATEFYAEVLGHPDEPRMRQAFEELAFFSTSVRVLGTYPASPFRGVDG